MFNTMKTIIHYTIRDFQFTVNIATTSVKRQWQCGEKIMKKVDVKNFSKTLTRAQLGLEHNNETIEINV